MSAQLLVTPQDIWNMLTQPVYVILYMVLLIILIVVIIVIGMVNESRFTNTTNNLCDAAEKNIQRAVEKASGTEEQEENTSRFGMLKVIDEQKKTAPKKEFYEEFTLAELCDNFRNFAASRLKLYYDIATIREFIAGLAVSRTMILQGMSGTGKTSLAFAFGEFIENSSTIIPVQPMWKERSDLLGYYNEFTHRYDETLLLQKMYEANTKQDIYITILDEMNIARVEYYFAEFLSLLEIPNPESRYLNIISDKWADDPEDLKNGNVKLPENMWFIGTANNDDSTFAISDKVYDRAMILNVDHRAEIFTAPPTETMPFRAERFIELVNEALEGASASPENLERLAELNEYLMQKFQVSFGNRIMKQINMYLPIYVACGGEELDALDDIITKKILRKLEMKNLTYFKRESEDLCDLINRLFGEDRMKFCLECIRRIAKNS